MVSRKITLLFLMIFVLVLPLGVDADQTQTTGGLSLVIKPKPSRIPLVLDNQSLNYLVLNAQPRYDATDVAGENLAGLKSPQKAAFLSLLLPGVGHAYTGSKTKSHIFFSTEAVAWISYLGFKFWEGQRARDYKNWAAAHADVETRDKPDEFWQMLTYYDSRSQYEIYGRAVDSDRPTFTDRDGWDWRWDSKLAQSRYRQLRNSSKEADRRGTFALGALLVNRVLAAIDAYRTAKLFNRKKSLELTRTDTKFRLRGSPFGSNPRVLLVIERRL